LRCAGALGAFADERCELARMDDRSSHRHSSSRPSVALRARCGAFADERRVVVAT
jgi:hypothetical protein